MKFNTFYHRMLFLLAALLLTVMTTRSVMANGFFQDDTGTSINDGAYDIDYMPVDSFINDERNPHNYYNPFKLESELKNSGKELIFQDFQQVGYSLEEKSEQAIRYNSLLPVGEYAKEDTSLSGIDLSELTSSSLIVSARKKQFFERLFPVLLNNQNIISQDRKRLEQLAGFFAQNSALGIDDEDWLKQLLKEYRLSEEWLEQPGQTTSTPISSTY